MDSFLDAIAEPLAALLRAAADWLDGDEGELDSVDSQPAPQWVVNDRGGFDPV